MDRAPARFAGVMPLVKFKGVDHEPNVFLSNAAPDEPLEVTPDLRLVRILDYQVESLTKPVALEACRGGSRLRQSVVTFQTCAGKMWWAVRSASLGVACGCPNWSRIETPAKRRKRDLIPTTKTTARGRSGRP
jgi:hypothetical protein